MSLSTDTFNIAASTQIHQCWVNRYLPDLALLPQGNTRQSLLQLTEVSSDEGRSCTVKKVKNSLRLTCEWAVIQTQSVFSSTPNITNLTETRSLAMGVEQAYEKILEVYQHLQFPDHFAELIHCAAIEKLGSQNSGVSLKTRMAQQELSALTLSFIHQLLPPLIPVLSQFQTQLLAIPDPQAFGFLTTHFHLCSRRILDRLSLYEKILLKPFLQFAEEQICIPWQRVCNAAARYSVDSPIFLMVEQLLAASQEISETVYQRAVQLFPHYQSRQGTLTHPQIAASSIRDLNMFQGYLWLCVLERDMAAIEQTLLPLCITVFPHLGVPWTFIMQGMRLLVDTIFSKLTVEQVPIVRPYTHALKLIFAAPLYDEIL
jgi:Phycobilisome protein